ncbi:MAG: DUF4185 domain-containing protein, partial [Myxococcales bacterium]|nr:DUF4185 domain-containing protein [Myxococcales bacterium]
GLLLSFLVLKKTNTGLMFEAKGGIARWVKNPDADLPNWNTEDLNWPAAPAGVTLGIGAILKENGFVHYYAPVEPGNHNIYVVRWKETDIVAGDLSKGEWFGSDGWSTDAGKSEPVVEGLQTEFSVDRTSDGDFLMVSTRGFGGADVVGRRAPKPEGPWSDAELLFHPPESDRPGVLIYSAKAHPEIKGGQLAITYCSNHVDFNTLLDDLTLYFPHFLRPQ